MSGLARKTVVVAEGLREESMAYLLYEVYCYLAFSLTNVLLDTRQVLVSSTQRAAGRLQMTLCNGGNPAVS